MCVELRMATDPSAAFHAGWYALVFALAKTRLSGVDERQVAANGATANRCENCLHQMIALAKSAGSVPGGSAYPNAPSVALSRPSSSAPGAWSSTAGDR